VALADISPGPGIELAGYPHHPRCNTGIHDPLYAGCICLDDGTTSLAIITTDLLMLSKREVTLIRDGICHRTAIPASNIMITCSHTHSGPWSSGRLDLEALEQGLQPDAAYMAMLRDSLVNLAIQAWDSRFEATVGVDRGCCGREQGVGGNRNDPCGIADPEVWVIGIKDDSGTLRACLAKYALHPTFLHSDNLQVSADYPGCIRHYLSGRKPGMAFLFAQGAAGNQSPRYFRSGKTYAEAMRVGSAIGAEVERVLDGMEFSGDARLVCTSLTVDLELRQLPALAEAERQVAAARQVWDAVRSAGACERDVWNAELLLLGAEDTLGYILARNKGTRIDLVEDELPAEVQVLGIGDARIGDARIVGLPGELFVEFGITIQYRAPFDKTIVVELANGVLPGYACTARAYAQGGYEVGTSLLTGQAGDQLVEAAVGLLNKTR
jgi:hypothetical protein